MNKMVDKKTIQASSLSGAGVFTFMFLLMMFNQAGDTQIGYCSSTNDICIAVDGFSGGSVTRCYNETDIDWWEAPYCKEGWVIVNNDLPEPIIEDNISLVKETTLNKKSVWGNKYNCDSNKCTLIS